MCAISLNEYGEGRGGVWYYTQNKFGSEWVNKVDNSKGWTVDFNLLVSDVQNSEWIIDDNNKGKGIGLYVNDGIKQENINFLTQQIVFSNANQAKIYDTTQEVDYRLTGKKDNLRLYDKQSGASSYQEISNVNFSKNATPNGNAFKPSIFEDTNGNLHVVWWDDGGTVGSLFYSKFDGETWTSPEEIVSLDNGVQFPSIVVDSNENIYVVFESKQTEGSVIGLVYKNNLGWSDPYYTGIGIGYCRHPKLTFDSQANVCVVWEDHRRTHQEIYLNIFLTNELSWKGEEKLSTNVFGSYRPSIGSYMDDLFITWTQLSEDNTSSIEIMKYNAINSQKTTPIVISRTDSRADYSNVLCNVSGRVFVVWHDNPEGKYRIYSTILSPSLDVLTEASRIVNGNGGARYPALSEQLATGDIHIVWQDYKDGDYTEFTSDSGFNPSEDPYQERKVQDQEPLNSAIFVATYNGSWFSSGQGSFDIKLIFTDERNTYFPNVPVFFTGELPIVYESYLFGEYGFVSNDNMLSRIRCAFYSLDRSNDEFLVDREVGPYLTINKDFLLNENISTKEIRFGDFSDVTNAHYIFKNFKYYLEDAVEPYEINEISSSTIGVDSISAQDIVVNNYGDVWIVGVCGMYYYFANQNRVLQIGKDLLGVETDVENENMDVLKTFKAIAFDKYNNMFVGGDAGVLRHSVNHVNGFKDLTSTIVNNITSIVFDKNNRMYVGTNSGLFAYNVTYSEDVESGVPDNSITITAIDPLLSSFDNYSSGYITSLKVDENNCLWIGTRSGIYRFFKDKFLKFTTVHGLPSDRVNDIAIRNTAIRYVATSNGIDKMVGFNFDSFITSEDDSIWNNNVKSIMWKDPNILFTGSMSRLNQIIINDVDETYSTVFYEPGSSINASPDDFHTYYLDTSEITITDDDIVEVYINGNKVHFGYDIGTNNETIRFKMLLDNSDIVEVIVRNDLEKVTTFEQTSVEKADVGINLLKIKDLATKVNTDSTGVIYAISEGTENEVKINDSNSILPFDRVHLDTHAPVFSIATTTLLEENIGIKIGEQIDRSIVKVSINGAMDDVHEIEGDVTTTLISEGSGIDTMIISNNDQFLEDDGTTSKTPVSFSTPVNHNLGLTLEDVVRDFTFSEGAGSVISYISSENELYAGTSNPAVVYKYNWDTAAWETLFTYDEDQHIDFIEKYNNNLIISVGHNVNPAIIYVYSYTSSGLIESLRLPLFESRGYSSHELDGKFYISSGTGEGDEYRTGSGDGGAVYLFNDGTSQNVDPSVSKIVEDVDDDVYALTSVTGSSNLLAATGPDAFIYEIDIENQAAFIVYNSVEPLVSLIHQADIGETFVGGDTNGTIRRSIVSNNTYDISFRTTPGKVSALKIFPVITGVANAVSYTSTFAAVGNVIYYLSQAGTWVWKYTHTEEINDMAFNDKSNKNTLYVISNSGITKINPLAEEKVVYLKLIDRAGNETVLNLTFDGENNVEVDDNRLVDSIDISNLVDFVNENRIFELDELGNTLYNLSGDSKFYSAEKIEEEKGEYISEIFDGTNDLVKWETLSWEVTELFNTQVLMYVRTSTSSNDILLAEWQGPYDSSQSAGVALSHLVGQFIQFKAVLISAEKSVTPTLHRVSIRAITSESVHFFTTNFVMSTKLNKGILTSKKIVPVSADVVFGLNTTNSIDWTEYQEIDENRIFNVNQTGHNLRVGIKFISPNRSTIDPTEFGEYGPYGSSFYINTVDFDFTNNSGITNNYHFRVSLYEDVNLQQQVFSASSADSPDGFSSNGSVIPSGGIELLSGSTAEILFTVPGSANIDCEVFYFVKIEYIYDSTVELFSNNMSFIASCTSSFIDVVNFDFTNEGIISNNYHFRIKFYQDLERTIEYKTVFSGNDRSGWFVDDILIPEAGALVTPGDTVSVVYRPDTDDFTAGSIFYITIEAHDGSDYVFSSNSYTFQVRDVQSTESCTPYIDVPIVENFGIMFELDSNEFTTLNI